MEYVSYNYLFLSGFGTYWKVLTGYFYSNHIFPRCIFCRYPRDGTLRKNYHSINTRLQKAVNHPFLVEHNVEKGVSNSEPTVKGFRSSSILNKIHLDDFRTSTKIEALREEIMFMFERDGSAKGIVFSQFTPFLDLIQYSLQKSDIKCVQLVGSTSVSARYAAVTRFTEDPDCRILLTSFKAGGVALDLTVASHVFLMDPCLNPDAEQQAQDRVHRMGQHKPVRIVRFIIKDTIEETILESQEKKKYLQRQVSVSYNFRLLYIFSHNQFSIPFWIYTLT
ncbi:hypothetical protein H5410_038047 [Solanum commersonii]|uniref:Helicase C-terminal domain-containing protein n=1 Tax=Solanum commersonii TaxID=4109 RepID=A0A9J5YA66_SOLCO|nr:hypothetical protein H5410_038047 [Solanum commersonii]